MRLLTLLMILSAALLCAGAASAQSVDASTVTAADPLTSALSAILSALGPWGVIAGMVLPIIVTRLGWKFPGLNRQSDPDAAPDLIDEGLSLLEKLRKRRSEYDTSAVIARVNALVAKHAVIRDKALGEQREKLAPAIPPAQPVKE